MPIGRRGDTDGEDKPSRKRKHVGKGFDADFRGFINLSLNDAEKAAYDQWAEGTTIWDVLEAQAADGVAVSVKVDPKSGGYMASATQRREDSTNAGLVVTARGKTAATAFGRVIYCLAILSREESWEATQPMADPDRW